MSITDKRLNDIQARIDAATHEFLPVDGHPDDDECTNRVDGTDDTYCGEPEAAHDVIPDEFSLDLSDLLAEVHRLRAELAKAREVTDEKVERLQKIMIDESSLAHEPDPHIRDVVREGIREQARLHVEAVLGGGDDA